jgi:Zn-dependent protease
MFRLFGFDVHVRTGFLLFLGLIVFLYQDAFGLWLAAALAGFTLLHELGHAVAARSAGAQAEISLDFLAGYTSFRPDPNRPLSRSRRAVISAAGPFTQIGVSLVVLAAMGINPVSLDSVRQSDAAGAIWWAGPIIGALNLIPVLPLDGGHLAMTGLETFLGNRATRVMVIASLVITGSAAAFMFLTGRGGFGIFVAFLLLNQFQLLQMTSKSGTKAHPAQRVADAEAHAWQTGRPGMLEPGQRLSPWFEAHQALSTGDAGGAMGVVLADLRSTKAPRWTPPSAATPEQLRAIVQVLPADLPPPGNDYSARVMAEILLATGAATRAGEFAAAAFTESRTSPLATVVARAAAAMGDNELALRWLSAAVDATAAEQPGMQAVLARTMDQALEFALLRHDPTFAALRSHVV